MRPMTPQEFRAVSAFVNSRAETITRRELKEIIDKLNSQLTEKGADKMQNFYVKITSPKRKHPVEVSGPELTIELRVKAEGYSHLYNTIRCHLEDDTNVITEDKSIFFTHTA